MKLITLLFQQCELAIRHDAANGFSAAARGPFGVLALAVVVIALAILCH